MNLNVNFAQSYNVSEWTAALPSTDAVRYAVEQILDATSLWTDDLGGRTRFLTLAVMSVNIMR